MTKYKITIHKIDEKKVFEEVYVSEEDRTSDHPETYKTVERTKEVTEQIYEQTAEGNISLKKIIDAFNETVSSGANVGSRGTGSPANV